VSIFCFPVAETDRQTQSFGNGANEDGGMQKEFED
jgi:hypothetical protein